MQDQLQALRTFFNAGATKEYRYRISGLKKLKKTLEKYEHEIYAALYADLKKSPEESWVTENGMVIAEINSAVRNLHWWMEKERVGTNLVNLPSSSYVLKEPMGVVLIIGPWNYPLQLILNPLVGALAAGNCVVLKPSELAPATAAVIKKIIAETFVENHVLLVEGSGAEIVPALMNAFVFDHVFYTGSTQVGKLIYKMAAENLVPVTLELGGKSPCIVEEDANIKVAAKRIAVSKFSNAGQMCVAPDYVLVHHAKKEELINELKKILKNFFGNNPEDSYNYGKIVNEKQFQRLLSYLNNGKLIYGGKANEQTLYLEPTLLTDVDLADAVMQDEIFGPILPIISFSSHQEAAKLVAEHKNPLAFYIFTSSRKMENEWLNTIPFGGGCVNNCSWHLTNHHLPFGGRGFSGTGRYHGKYSFDTFSHTKAVMKTPTWFDPAIKYPPFKGKLKLFKWVIR